MMKKFEKRTVRHIAEGDRIYREMKQAMLSVSPTIGCAVAMNYALSKLIANYKLAMQKLDVDIDTFMREMVRFWEQKLERGDDDDQLDFDAFAYTVERLTESQG